MKPSEIGLAVYRHHYLNDQGNWMLGGFSLAKPDGIEPDKERYEPTDDVTDEVGGVAVYLFGSDAHRSQFTAGLFASGDDLNGWAAGVTSLGHPGLIREFGSHEAFAACTRTNEHSSITVFDYRKYGADARDDHNLLNPIVSILHRKSKKYGGNMAASPEFLVCLIDQRAEKGEVAIGLWPAADASGDSQIIVSACLDTMPGGSRTVPQIKVHHHGNQRRLFHLYKHSALEYMLLPDPNVKFKPHLMTNGTMGFIVSDDA